MYTGVAMFCRQRRIVYHIVFLVLTKLHESSSAYSSQQECVEYTKVCSEYTTSHNNCGINLSDQVRIKIDHKGRLNEKFTTSLLHTCIFQYRIRLFSTIICDIKYNLKTFSSAHSAVVTQSLMNHKGTNNSKFQKLYL